MLDFDVKIKLSQIRTYENEIFTLQNSVDYLEATKKYTIKDKNDQLEELEVYEIKIDHLERKLKTLEQFIKSRQIKVGHSWDVMDLIVENQILLAKLNK